MTLKQSDLRERFWQACGKWDLWGYGGFGLPRMELEGDRFFLIEDHRGLLEYGPERVRLAAGELTVTVEGSGLELCSMECGALALRGRVRCVTLDR